MNSEVCKFCLKVVTDYDYMIFSSHQKELVQILFGELDMNDNKNICLDCNSHLEEAFAFKCKCIEIEDNIHNYITDERKQIDLEQIVGVENETESENKICRTCLELVESVNCISIYNNQLMQIFKQCLHELNLQLTQNPVVCKTCNRSILRIFRFCCLCIESQKKIENFNSNQKTDYIEVLALNEDNKKITNKKEKSELEKLLIPTDPLSELIIETDGAVDVIKCFGINEKSTDLIQRHYNITCDDNKYEEITLEDVNIENGNYKNTNSQSHDNDMGIRIDNIVSLAPENCINNVEPGLSNTDANKIFQKQQKVSNSNKKNGSECNSIYPNKKKRYNMHRKKIKQKIISCTNPKNGRGKYNGEFFIIDTNTDSDKTEKNEDSKTKHIKKSQFRSIEVAKKNRPTVDIRNKKVDAVKLQFNNTGAAPMLGSNVMKDNIQVMDLNSDKVQCTIKELPKKTIESMQTCTATLDLVSNANQLWYIRLVTPKMTKKFKIVQEDVLNPVKTNKIPTSIAVQWILVQNNAYSQKLSASEKNGLCNSEMSSVLQENTTQTTTENYLQQFREQSVSGISFYYCEFCGLDFKDETDAKKHIVDCVNIDTSINAELSSKNSESELPEVNDDKDLKKLVLLKCDICAFDTRILNKAVDHIISHLITLKNHLSNTFYCTLCYLNFLFVRDLYDHVKQVHHKTGYRVLFWCVNCKECYPIRSKLMRHLDLCRSQQVVNLFRSNNIIYCMFCGDFECSNITNAKEHLRLCVNSPIKKIQDKDNEIKPSTKDDVIVID